MLKQRTKDGKTEVFDIVRRKWVPMTEEETVRQFLIHFIVEEKKIPVSHLSVERQITVNGLTRRYDLVIFNNLGKPQLVIECKAPHIELSQEVIEQVGRYNKTLHAPFIGVSNGRQHFFFRINFATEEITFCEDFPNL
ncbi:MAG: type I restriction enzyme HsdR N-terminal domain-containing protein [Bacteroidales bacterium]|nr:type I restriction enzyme HsdR N-terminal domain-containing protein [Bacteroidales bacterium]